MAPPLDPFISRTHIAYFSMEMAVRPEMHIYVGGLGILAGDTARSCADLELPLVSVTLVSRAGYFRQRIDDRERQVEEPDPWRPEEWCIPLESHGRRSKRRAPSVDPPLALCPHLSPWPEHSRFAARHGSRPECEV